MTKIQSTATNDTTNHVGQSELRADNRVPRGKLGSKRATVRRSVAADPHVAETKTATTTSAGM